MNNVNLTGRLTADAEVKQLNSGTTAVKMSLAFDTLKKDEMGNWAKESNFITVKYFTKLSWQLEHLKKGQLLIVSGSLKQERWESDGTKHSQIVLMAQEIEAVNKISKQEDTDKPKATSSDDVPF